MITSKITAKGQLTLPKAIREFLNVDIADRIEFTLLEDGKVLITGKKRPARKLFGILKHKKRPNPVSPEEMDLAIKKRRLDRNTI